MDLEEVSGISKHDQNALYKILKELIKRGKILPKIFLHVGYLHADI